MKSVFSNTSQHCELEITVLIGDTLPSPVPEKAFVVFSRNGNEVGKTESSICTGKGNASWNYPINFKVTMYTDDENTFKEKRLAIKIKEPRKDKTVAKGEVNLSPLLSLDGSVKKIRLLLDPKRSGKWSDAKDLVGLTVSIKPTWVDRKDDEPVSEMSEQVNQNNSSEEEDEPDLNMSLSNPPANRTRSGSGGRPQARPGPGHRRTRSQSSSSSSDVGHRGELNKGGISVRQRSGSRTADSDNPGNPFEAGTPTSAVAAGAGGDNEQVEDLQMQIQVLKDRVQISEDAARESQSLLEHRTRIMQENVSGDGAAANSCIDVEKIQDENEALQMRVTALTAQLDVSCAGSRSGIQKPSGLSTQDKEYIEMLEMELIQAKTTIAELKAGYDEVEKSKRELETQKETWKSGRGHRRTNSRGGAAAFANTSLNGSNKF